MPESVDTFECVLHRAVDNSVSAAWGFVLLPKSVSATFPRRGRTTVEGAINGCPFSATLEPDVQLSHWLKVEGALLADLGVSFGDSVQLQVRPVDEEPEPQVPEDFQKALVCEPAAKKVWEATTTIARLDWIHWITSAKQSKTRKKRIGDALEMLAKGKKRVCCCDPSGYYSKALSAPQVANT